MTRTALVALLALCALAPALAGQSTRESMEDTYVPPKEFPNKKAEPYSPDRMPTPKAPNEASDMRESVVNETETVNHPKVKDPGTTHAEGSEGGRGSIHACTLPNIQDGEPNSSASDWLADSGNVTKVCHLPAQWLNGTSGTLRVCSIPRDAWNSSYAVSDGTIPKELLAELSHTTNVTCVTPSEALGNGNGSAVAGADDSIANGSIPSAWLRDGDDNIYIYIIPQAWLRASKPVQGKASEVEDLTKDSVAVTPPTPAPNGTASVPVLTPLSTVAPLANASAANPGRVMIPSGNPSNTEATTPTSNATGSASTAAPVEQTAKPNDTQTVSTAIPVVLPKDEVTPTQKAKATERPTEEITKPKEATTQKPKDETTKAAVKPAPEVPTATTEKPEVKVTAKPKETITEIPKEVKPEPHHSESENEIAHGVVSPPSPEALSQQHSDHNHAASSGKTAFLQPTESAAILAGVFVAIALLGYAGLLLWRRVLEKRYGNREMLVNEDDDFDTSDMRHFEL